MWGSPYFKDINKLNNNNLYFENKNNTDFKKGLPKQPICTCKTEAAMPLCTAMMR